MPEELKLAPDDIRTILKNDPGTRETNEVDLVKKVASGQPLSSTERGNLETKLEESGHKERLSLVVDASQQRVRIRRKPGNKPGYNGRNLDRDYAVRARRLIIVELRMQYPPLSIKQIAAKMGMSLKLVIKDLNAMREEVGTLFDGTATHDLVARSLQAYDLIIAKAMTAINTYTNPSIKVSMMGTAKSTIDSKLKALLDIGIVKKAAERHELTGPNGQPLPTGSMNMTLVQRVAAIKQRREVIKGEVAQITHAKPSVPIKPIPLPEITEDSTP